MPQSKAPHPYPDLRQLLDRALEAPTGVKLQCTSPGAALSRMMRLYTVRTRDREHNATVYPPDHPMHNRSVYDVLSFHREDEQGNYVPANRKGVGHVLVIRKAENIPGIEEF